jgi:catechol 2,3-dioxygenase-like lactoylglutathione lyase family enzyme
MSVFAVFRPCEQGKHSGGPGATVVWSDTRPVGDRSGRLNGDVRLHHVNIVVPTGRTADVSGFYADVLGLTPVPKPAHGVGPGGAWFDIDAGTQLHVSERADAVMHEDMHFALVVDDIAATVARLEAAGAPWREQPDLFGGRRGSTRDPLGNRIELLERAGQLA